jgi:hypothetical protein
MVIRKRRTKGLEKSVRGYLVGILFILIGPMIVGVSTYLASIIPPTTLTSTGMVINNPPQSVLGSPIVSNSVYMDNSNDAVSTWNSVSPSSGQVVLVVWDITNFSSNPDAYGMSVLNTKEDSWYILASPSKDSANGGYFAWNTVDFPAGGSDLGFNTKHTGWVSVSVFLISSSLSFNAKDIALALGYTGASTPNNAGFSITNTVFINLLGFAAGIMTFIIGLKKLGLRL